MKFYRDKKVLVTGHTGFKGTWLCWLLSSLGAETFGYALPAPSGSLHEQACPRLSGFRLDDIRNQPAVAEALNQFQPDVIFHLASHSYLDGSYEFPERIFDINLMGTVRLLEAVRQSGRHTPVVVITSDKCYTQQMQGRPCRENDPLGAAEAYSTSKTCQDLAAQCYQVSFPEISAATARASNTIGGGDFHETRLTPYLLSCFSRGETAYLRNPNFIRPWQSVLDVLWGYLTLGKALSEGNPSASSAFNFGPAPDGFQTVARVAEILAGCFPNASYELGEQTGNRETEVLRLDSQKAWDVLGWRPVCSLAETLALAAEFSKRAVAEPAAQICQEQVEQYIRRIRFTEEKSWIF